jgi:hypothetical protein
MGMDGDLLTIFMFEERESCEEEEEEILQIK